jgi:hypothetical protein
LHAGPIDRCNRFVFRFVSAMRDRRLTLEKTGWRTSPLSGGRVIVISPIAMSRPFASKSDLRVDQVAFTISSFRPERLREAHRHVDVDSSNLVVSRGATTMLAPALRTTNRIAPALRPVKVLELAA